MISHHRLYRILIKCTIDISIKTKVVSIFRIFTSAAMQCEHMYTQDLAGSSLNGHQGD